VVSADGRPIVVLSLLISDGLIDSGDLIANTDKLVGVSRIPRAGAPEGA